MYILLIICKVTNNQQYTQVKHIFMNVQPLHLYIFMNVQPLHFYIFMNVQISSHLIFISINWQRFLVHQIFGVIQNIFRFANQ